MIGMRTKKRLSRVFTLGLVAAALYGMSVPHIVFAEQNQTSLTYDPATEATFVGIVTDINGGPGRLGWLMRAHTFGLGHKGAADKALILKTDTETVRIHLGPTAFLSKQEVDIEDGDSLTVTGSRLIVAGASVVLAREIRKGATVWGLRNSAGEPLWSTPEPETRRFWTTTKVVLVVVAAKIALLATVLRH